ncbi:MAG: hypothetical protein QM692_10030 [Thermomicrobiales bacterium]
MASTTSVFGILTAVLGAGCLLGSTLAPAAAGTVTQVIGCGESPGLAASIADATLAPLAYSTHSQESSGNLLLTATETGCAGLGWNVTIQASPWISSTGAPALSDAGFAVTQIANPGLVTGQPIDAAQGPLPVNAPGTLDHSRKVLQANAGFGIGSYTQVLGVQLSVPAGTPPGAYTTVVTTTIVAGP